MSEDIATATADILEFMPKREYVWQHRCAALGQEFFLHGNGSIQCSGCKEIVDNLVWGKKDQK